MNKNITMLTKVYFGHLEITMCVDESTCINLMYAVLKFYNIYLTIKWSKKIQRKAYNVWASVGSEHIACISMASASKTL